jgi:Na+-transporting NADH:ubiquinone oxidoreductase subunit D
MVILVDEILQAFAYDVSKQLSVFVGLIITNCIIMGRLEAFALANKPWPAFLDGVGNAAGYGVILIIVAFFRELLGSGTVWDYPLFEKLGIFTTGYENNGLMILPPMALITVGIIIWIQRARNRKLIEEN